MRKFWFSFWLFPQQIHSDSSPSIGAEDGTARQLGNLKGRVLRGELSDNPWHAKPNVYPNAIPTGTATAFPTCMYLEI